MLGSPRSTVLMTDAPAVQVQRRGSQLLHGGSHTRVGGARVCAEVRSALTLPSTRGAATRRQVLPALPAPFLIAGWCEVWRRYSWFDTHTNNHNYEKLRTSELIFDTNESVAVPVGETYARL